MPQRGTPVWIVVKFNITEPIFTTKIKIKGVEESFLTYIGDQGTKIC